MYCLCEKILLANFRVTRVSGKLWPMWGIDYVSVLKKVKKLFSLPVLFILVLALLHEFTDTEVHCKAFSTICSMIPEFQSPKTVVITDREGSILNAIKKIASLVKVLLCWKHIRQVIILYFGHFL